MASTRSATQPNPTMMPARAMPSPFCWPLDRLICPRAMKPKMMPRMPGMNKRNPAQPQTNAAIANPFVFCLATWP